MRIPNEEIRQEFQKTIHEVKHEATLRRLNESEKLFEDTLQGHEEAVAAQIEKVHAEETAPLHYKNEQSLRAVIKLAYFTYKDHYVQLEELPGGRGIADMVYLPKKGSDLPALVIELKWNQDAEGAIDQIRKRKYPQVLRDYGSEILLVGISYNKYDQERKHHCIIERFLPEDC